MVSVKNNVKGALQQENNDINTKVFYLTEKKFNHQHLTNVFR